MVNIPSRSRKVIVGSIPATSCECERQRPSKNCVVGGFPKSWHNGPQHYRDLLRVRQAVDQFSRLIRHHERVNVDIALGMPFRLLRNADQRLHFRENLLDDAEFIKPVAAR